MTELGLWVWCGITWIVGINWDSNAVTAAATVTLAGLTIVLGFAGAMQYCAVMAQVSLARDEFNATHRPKLFIQSVSVTDKGARKDWRDETQEARPATGIITIVNGGDSPALIIEWRARIYYQSSVAAFVPHLETAQLQSPIPQPPSYIIPWIPPGGFEFVDHIQPNPIDDDWESFVETDGRMYFIGRVTYEGRDGVRRNTGFCREYDRVTEGRWKPVKDSEYEYSY